jgi:hypothetical protein
LIVRALEAEFTVRGFVVVAEPPLTVAELNTYCVPPMICGVAKRVVQFVLAFHVKFAGVV